MQEYVRLELPGPINLRSTLGPLSLSWVGRGAMTADTAQWAAHTAHGPATMDIRSDGSRGVEARAVGPGAEALLQRLPHLIGAGDDPEKFAPGDGLLRRLRREQRGLRLGSTQRVIDVIVPAILGQRVTSQAAARSYRTLTRRYGKQAPDSEVWLPPLPDVLAALPYWAFHELGVERRRAAFVIEAARRWRRLEQVLTMSRDAARARLLAMPGVGEWTAGHVMGMAYGDPDAVPVGDYHLPNTVAWALAGEARGDDDRMLELLAPYAGQRRRVVLLIKGAGISAPKFGPRLPIHSFEAT